MKGNRADTGTITGIAEATAERVRLSGEILKAMAHALAANEQTQRRFRYAIINKLARIEVLLGLLHVSQLARDQRPVEHYAEKLLEDSRAGRGIHFAHELRGGARDGEVHLRGGKGSPHKNQKAMEVG